MITTGKGPLLREARIATGSTATIPPIPGGDKSGLYAIEKSLSAMTALREEGKKAKSVVILRGGFIGAEFADEFARNSDTEVHIVEMMLKVLSTAFDDEFCDEIASVLLDSGVKIHGGIRALSIDGNKHVDSVTLEDGEKIRADIVIIGVGGRPNTQLAEKAGLRLTDGGSIWVDSYMRTKVENVFAVGDCALKRDFFTRQEVPVWLASTATAEARIAGTNLYGIRVLRQIQGTISAFSTKIGDVSFGSAGLTCRTCQKEGVDFIPHKEILTYEEILHLVRLATRIGIGKIRLTGREPLVCKEVKSFIRELFKIDKLKEISLTTNGVLLKRFAADIKGSGMCRLNVGLDYLKPERFYQITGREYFDRVWEGILEAERLGLNPIKINAVAMKGVNDDEILDFARLSLKKPLPYSVC